MNVTKIFEEIDGEKISINLYTAINNRKPHVMVLHGAGDGTKERCDGLCQILLQKGVGSLSFDFSGCGESSNKYPISINKRIKEASRIADKYMEDNFSIAAFSMSGHIAVELSSIYKNRVHSLMLLSPAVYSDECITLDFGDEFSKCIRRKFSYLNSSIWQKIQDYQGKVLLITPEYDDVIPQDVFSKIEECSADFYQLKLNGATHSIGKWINQNKVNAAFKLDTMLSIFFQRG